MSPPISTNRLIKLLLNYETYYWHDMVGCLKHHKLDRFWNIYIRDDVLKVSSWDQIYSYSYNPKKEHFGQVCVLLRIKFPRIADEWFKYNRNRILS